MTTSRFDKLVTLLKELFQLDKPELDFGFYRIMHARSAEVTRFLEEDLGAEVQAALREYGTAERDQVERELRQAVAQAEGLGVDPESADKVKALRAQLNDAADLAAVEADVYDHLHRFFRRYYKDGDFISQRVYKDSAYAIPYHGEEVKLHWANADQYYIKTDEYLKNYSFRLRPDAPGDPMRVHFRLVDAAEGEHDNVKPAAARARMFVLAGGDFAFEETGDDGSPKLVLCFEYRPARLGDWPEAERAARTRPPAQKALLEIAESRIAGIAVSRPSLHRWLTALERKYVKADGTTSDKSRLRLHLERYTARNTFDYFIHKDLGGFLRRELDFYIKNEVMRLDDIENRDVPGVELYLSRIRAIRRSALPVIDFLASLENFQKRLWLKKKFVVETSWLVRLGCIPDEFLPEIAASDAQRREWVELCGIDAIKGDMVTPGYSEPLTAEFLKSQPSLVLDTQHFGQVFEQRLVELIADMDAHGPVDNLLVHGENFQCLNVLSRCFRGKVHCMYIDPNYNTAKDDFLYKDGYKRSAWLTMISDRLRLARRLLSERGLLFCSIDEHETARLRELGEATFGHDCFIAELIWDTKHSQQSGLFKPYHEYVQVFGQQSANRHENFSGGSGEIVAGAMKRISSANPASNFSFPAGTTWMAKDGTELRDRWGDVETVELISGQMLCSRSSLQFPVTLRAAWTQRRQMESFFSADDEAVIDTKGQEVIGFFFNREGKLKIRKRRSRITPKSVLPSFGTTGQATAALRTMFGSDVFGRPKPLSMVKYLVSLPLDRASPGTVLDFFAGSGTTGHAVVNLNRDDGGDRRFILVEMGDHFHTVLAPRLKKVIYSPKWKNGKPVRQATAEEAERSPRIMKVLRLESYEDTLNNLHVRLPPTVSPGPADHLRDYYPPPPRNSEERASWPTAASGIRPLENRRNRGATRAVRSTLRARRWRPARRLPSRSGALCRSDGLYAQGQAAGFGRELRNAGRSRRDVQLAAGTSRLAALGASAG